MTEPAPASAPTLTVGVQNFGEVPGGGGDWRVLLDLARHAEAAGVDTLVVPDHLVMGRNTDEYSWGRFPTPPEAPWLEPLTVLTAMGAVTERLRLATGILIAPLRPAAVLAKTVATLDVLTGGRVDLGVGVGWQREEFDAVGLDFARRGQLLTDTVAACRALWENLPASFSSETMAFEDTFCSPQPVQSPLPIWFSGVLHARNLDRLARLGDGWIPIMGATVDEIADGVQTLRKAFAAHGRDPAGLQVRAPVVVARRGDRQVDLDATMASVPDLVAVGATEINADIRLTRSGYSDPADAYGQLVEAFRRHL